jgi:hypothetical protein
MLKEKITEDLKNAMKIRDANKISVLRMVKSAVKKFEVDAMKEATDEDVLKIITKEVKMRQEAIEGFKTSRPNLAKEEEAELEVLKQYLPKQLNEEEIKKEIIKVVKETNATGPKDFGKVMKTVVSRLQGKANGKIINKLVHQVLEA